MNKNYIAVIAKKSNGEVKFEKREIKPMFNDVIEQMEAMVKNPNRNILDIQTLFATHFKSKEHFYLCLPYSYSSSYITGTPYPEMISYDEYHKILNNYSTPEGEHLLDKKKRELKNHFFLKAKQYIECFNYSRTISEVKNQKNTLMLSTENIGWTTYEYKINEDMTISIHTNFGYGWSSYFYLCMKYKGIDILPYSAIVKYYYADVIELRRYTRNYLRERNSWKDCFAFVEETVNFSTKSPMFFIEKWVINEVKEMMRGLKRIATNPAYEIERLFKDRGARVGNGIINVRYANNYDKEDYKIYKDETDVVFKAEKITGALQFLDNLTQFSKILPVIQEYIDEIKELNIRIQPEILNCINKVQRDIDRITPKRIALEEKIEAVGNLIKPHSEKIDKLIADNTSKKRHEILSDYKKENPEYITLCNERDELNSELSPIVSEIIDRNHFISRLSSCIELIESSIAA